MPLHTQPTRKLFDRKEWAMMVEYGLLVALIAYVCMVVASASGISLKSIFNVIAGGI
jgi:Flp pilus assembly pilin Flp